MIRVVSFAKESNLNADTGVLVLWGATEAVRVTDVNSSEVVCDKFLLLTVPLLAGSQRL